GEASFVARNSCGVASFASVASSRLAQGLDTARLGELVEPRKRCYGSTARLSSPKSELAEVWRYRHPLQFTLHGSKERHHSVWTSTDNTAGRSRTMGAQLFPAPHDA